MMNRGKALRLAEQLKRRTRDPDVLALCRYVEGERQTPAFRRPCDVDVNVNAPVAPKRGRPPTPGAVRGDMAAYMRKWRAARKARLGGLQVNDEVVLGRRLHRQISGLLAFEDAVDIVCRRAKLTHNIGSIRD